MRIINLMDNISLNPNLKSEHGLSYYIETSKHRILFDCGQSDAFIKNAYELNVDLKTIDIVVISHGHYDHGGGLEAFLALNKQASVYLQHDAFNHFYTVNLDHSEKYIGLNQHLIHHPQIKRINQPTYVIDEQLTLYSSINQKELNPLGNHSLIEKRGSQAHLDTFSHEQNLLINEEDKHVLMAGCAHSGIVNIIHEISERLNVEIKHVFGGFHMYNLTKNEYEDDSRIKQIGEALLNTKATFYAGHCTGFNAYELLKTIMHDKIEYNSVGMIRII